MKLTGEEVNIVTYLPVLKNRKLVKNQVIYGQKTKKKSNFFGKIEKNPNFFHYLSPKLALGFKYAEVTPGRLERLVGDPNDGWFAAFGGVN